jgi:hypothetical protein
VRVERPSTGQVVLAAGVLDEPLLTGELAAGVDDGAESVDLPESPEPVFSVDELDEEPEDLPESRESFR